MITMMIMIMTMMTMMMVMMREVEAPLCSTHATSQGPTSTSLPNILQLGVTNFGRNLARAVGGVSVGVGGGRGNVGGGCGCG